MIRSTLILTLAIFAGCATAPEAAPEPAPEPEPEPAGIRELPHLDSTPAELRAEIDRLVVALVDFDAGAEGMDAQDRLVEIGRPALPKVLSAFLHTGAWEDRIGMLNACLVDDTLRRMRPEEEAFTEIPSLKPFAQPTAGVIRRVAELWFEWWDAERGTGPDPGRA